MGCSVPGRRATTSRPSPPSPASRRAPASPAAAQLADALEEIQAAYAAGQEALKTGDFTAYDQAQKRLDAAIKRANAIAPLLTSGHPVAVARRGSPSPSPSPVVLGLRRARRGRPEPIWSGPPPSRSLEPYRARFHGNVTHSTRGGAAR